MFKEKIPYEYTDPVTVSVRFTYMLKHFSSAAYIPKRKFAFGDRQDDDTNVDFKSNAVLPFGVSVDPVRDLVLYCKWPEVAENVVVDSRNYSDFDPMLAPNWSFRLHYEAIPNSFLYECLFEFLQECDSPKTLADLIGAEYSVSAISELSCSDDKNPLERLTVSKISKITTSMLSVALATDPSTSTTAKKPSKKLKPMEGPLKDEQLMAMLYYLFPDAQENSLHPYNIPDTDNVSIFEDGLFL